MNKSGLTLLIILFFLTGCNTCYQDDGKECEKYGQINGSDMLDAMVACHDTLSDFEKSSGYKSYTSIKKKTYWYKSNELEISCIDGSSKTAKAH